MDKRPAGVTGLYNAEFMDHGFLKVQTHQYLSPETSKKLSPLVTRLAKGEGLEAHKKAGD